MYAMALSKPWPDHLEIPESWKQKTEAEIADRLGDLENLFSLLSELFNERDQLRALAYQRVESKKIAANEETHLTGERWRIKVSARERRRRIKDRAKLKRLLIARGLWEKAWSVTLEFLDRYLEKEKHELVIVEQRTGPRNLKPVSLESLKALENDPAICAALQAAGVGELVGKA